MGGHDAGERDDQPAPDAARLVEDPVAAASVGGRGAGVAAVLGVMGLSASLRSDLAGELFGIGFRLAVSAVQRTYHRT